MKGLSPTSADVSCNRQLLHHCAGLKDSQRYWHQGRACQRAIAKPGSHRITAFLKFPPCEDWFMEWPQEALRSVATHFLQKACMFTRHTKTDLQMWDSLGCRCIRHSLFPVSCCLLGGPFRGSVCRSGGAGSLDFLEFALSDYEATEESHEKMIACENSQND